MSSFRNFISRVRQKRYTELFAYLFLSVVVICVYALLAHVFSWSDVSFQIVAVVLSVVFAAVVTNTLLSGQADKEEERDKSIRIYQSKIDVFSQFVKSMWAMVSNGDFRPEEIKKFRSEVFGKLIFYLDDKKQIGAIKDTIKEVDWNSSDPTTYVKPFSRITDILKANLINGQTDSDTTNSIHLLWNSFPMDVVYEQSDNSEDNEPEIPVQPVANEGTSSSTINCVDNGVRRIGGCLHFNILNTQFQYEIFNSTSVYFSNGTCALGLVEFGETWRTDRIKSSRKDQMVFLYQSGGPGYVGAFLVKGWVVIESEGDGKVSRVVERMFDSDEVELPEGRFDEYQDRFSARSWIQDGYTRASFMIVEPLFFSESGVGRISVYRSTISSYDPSYAWRTLSRMAAVAGSGTTTGTYMFNGEKKRLPVNDDDFKKLIEEYNVQPSERDTVSNGWIDKQ